MLSNIFLLKGGNFNELNHLDIYSYPKDISKEEHRSFINKIIFGQDHGLVIDECLNENIEIESGNTNNLQSFVIESPIPQTIENKNVFTLCINKRMLIGLIFDYNDNPYDYKEIFEDLSNELLNNEKCCSFDDEIEIDNLLITLFIDIRRYGDEILEKDPNLNFPAIGMFTKVFLFGIDEVGKSSLVRRLKTGLYNDNYLAPTRNFNIEYLQREQGQLALWDLPGQLSFRKKWLIGIQDSNVLVYMIDIANQIRFEEAKREFWNVINRPEFSHIPLVIIGNKIDLLNNTDTDINEHLGRTEQEINNIFEFKKLGNRDWKFIFTSVKTNFNVDDVIKTIFTITEPI